MGDDQRAWEKGGLGLGYSAKWGTGEGLGQRTERGLGCGADSGGIRTVKTRTLRGRWQKS